MKYALKDLVEIPRLQELTDSLYQAAGIPSAIITQDGEVLTASGWQRICSEFHRMHPQIAADCVASDTSIRERMRAGDPFAMYTCPMGLTDASIPVVIEGEHVANAFAGQFLLEPPDAETEERFRQQARRFGLDEETYLAAFREVPVLPLGRFRPALLFLAQLAQVIAELGLQRKRQLEILEQFNQSERRFRQLVEQAGDAIEVLDADGRYIDVNTAALTSLGYTKAEMLALTVFDVDPQITRAGFAANFEALTHHGPITFESTHRRKDGTALPVEVTASVFESGGAPRALSLVRDISSRQQSLHALKEQTLEIRRSLEIAQIGHWVWDCASDATQWSDEMQKIFGVSGSPDPGSSQAMGLSSVHPDDRERVAAAVASVRDLIHPDAFDYRVIRPDGTTRHLRAFPGHCELDEAGRAVRISGVVQDVTESKMAERERDRLEGQLQQAMKMEAIGRLAGGVAHDFNNLLTTITGNVSLALMDLRSDDPLAAILSEVDKAAASAASLTRQLLAFSRKQIIEPRVLDLNELVSNLHKMMRRLIGEDIDLQVTLAAQLGAVKIDAGQFEQVLVNLAVNAKDAMPDGGQLVVETANVDLDEPHCAIHRHLRPGRFVMLAVSDTGHGMSPEVKAHLFEPFFTTKARGRGTGLGLATIFGVVQQAGGAIDVYSEVGHGTSFKIFLPRAETKAERLDTERRRSDMPGGTETVLLVEDEAMVRELATRLLKRWGYTVLVASDGGQAQMLAELRTGPIDLLMTDVVMPGINGHQLADRLTTQMPGLRVLFTSGYTENIIVHDGTGPDRSAFIAKPYSPPALARKVRDVLDRP
ncbi:MAG: PocR ligand-binding domain-containing protein [Acidobacteriota bacterium]